MSKVKQVTLAELLEDPIYQQWFDRPPVDHDHTRWRVYVKRKKKSPWAKRDFDTWKRASKFVAKNSSAWYDCVLVCRNDAFRPPVITVPATKEVELKNGKTKVVKYQKRQYYAPMVNYPGHTWCPHCRRPTVFGWFTSHHAFPPSLPPLPYKKRCGICGIAQQAIKEYVAKEDGSGT